MDALKETLFSFDIIGWVILAIMIVLAVRLLLKTGAILLSLGALVALGFVLFRFFPGVVQPILDWLP